MAIAETETVEKVAFTALPRLSDHGNSVALEEIKYPEDKNYAPEITSALVDTASQILDLRNFDLKEMSLRLKHLEVQSGKMILVADARIEDFPNAD